MQKQKKGYTVRRAQKIIVGLMLYKPWPAGFVTRQQILAELVQGVQPELRRLCELQTSVPRKLTVNSIVEFCSAVWLFIDSQSCQCLCCRVK